MENLELRAWIAEKVMGYVRVSATCYRPYGSTHIRNVEDLEPYELDIAAAFEVVEKMREKGYSFCCEAAPNPSANHVMFFRINHSCEFTDASSLPLAICLAARAALESK